jgi:U4/U6.U5 tri-snRNP component SNU23
MIVERAKLKPRDHEIDLAAKLNKSQVQSFSMDPNQQGGYYCDVCDCSLKDSLAYLDHINGKYHNRNLGMSMEVERSTVDQVRKRLEIAKKKKRGLYVEPDEDGDTKYLTYGDNDDKDDDDDEENVDGSKGSDEEEDSETQEMAKLMGFGSFG